MTTTVPIVMSASGPVPSTPAALQAQLLASAAAISPGYTANLPGIMIEDISSTCTLSMVEVNQAAVELINSITPYGANAFLLTQIGVMEGVLPGQDGANTSVYVVFAGNPGFVIGKGFLVSDGNFQYAVKDGGTIASAPPGQLYGQTPPMFCVATQSGTWAVPPGTVTLLASSVPDTITLSVVNPQSGIPGTGAQTIQDYRADVLQANLVTGVGMATMLRTLLRPISGVQQRLIRVLAQEGGGFLIMVGGGDPYEVANAIYLAVQDVSTLVPSDISVTNLTAANPGVVTTDITHGHAVGDTIQIELVNPNNYDGTYQILSVISEYSFSLGTAYPQVACTGASWAGTSGGQVTFTTSATHHITVGSTFQTSGFTPVGYNGTFVAIAGTSGTTLVAALVSNPGVETIAGNVLAGIARFSTSGFPAWVSGGVVTPNARNVPVSITDYPDTYVIPIVVPPQQTVTATVTWGTTSSNFVSNAAMAQLAAPALAAYVNTVPAGMPLNLLDMQDAFRIAVASIIQPSLITTLQFAVAIDGSAVSPESGTEIIPGDAQSFLFAEVLGSGFNIVQAI